jgi:hypothetical protein
MADIALWAQISGEISWIRACLLERTTRLRLGFIVIRSPVLPITDPNQKQAVLTTSVRQAQPMIVDRGLRYCLPPSVAQSDRSPGSR